jgi:hypothetical protein
MPGPVLGIVVSETLGQPDRVPQRQNRFFFAVRLN